MDFDHLPRLVELPFQMGEFLAQSDHLALARIRLRPTSFLGQAGQSALIALLTPLADQGRIEALAPQQGTLARLAQAFISRYVVGWMLAAEESAALAERLLAETICEQSVDRDQLTIHA